MSKQHSSIASKPSESSSALVVTPVQQSVLDKLYALSSQLIPFLEHSEFSADDSLQRSPENSPAIISLYNHLAKHHPLAGKSYWAHKCWQLCIWQPVFLSIICVYALQISLPISQLKIARRHASIYGYQLAVSSQYQGTTEQLIRHISSECRLIIDSFYQQISSIYPLKRRLSKQLLSDQLLAGLARVPSFLEYISEDLMQQQSQWWLRGLALEPRPINKNSQGEIIRISCCLEYRTQTSGYCNNCPKESARTHVTT